MSDYWCRLFGHAYPSSASAVVLGSTCRRCGRQPEVIIAWTSFVEVDNTPEPEEGGPIA